MQFGHIAVALAIATYDWSAENAAFCLAMHYLPNVDSLIVKGGWDKKIIRAAVKLESFVTGRQNTGNPETDRFWVEYGGFHCTVTHSLFFAIIVSLLIALFSRHFAAFAFIAIITHYLADIGSTVGLPLLWPLSRKKSTLSLFRDTGWWGKDMLIGYYRQPIPWLLEGAALIFFIYRLSVL